jgi:hypothetical protein
MTAALAWSPQRRYLTDDAHRRQALSEARRVLQPGGRLEIRRLARERVIRDGR